ncbi:hypothetical protein FOL47_004346 [Perkinsus chesapeaki]|uniref:Uncharacterized protein n=1 Tax=Perkinsus chesapeaki TaxID=330153 RepID=A0A7J6M377_PERCH|nr:hypothetical protein FOL47_004346 [Perkinsus chesapeaki]
MTIILGNGDSVEIIEEVVEAEPRTVVDDIIVEDDFGDVEVLKRVTEEPSSVVDKVIITEDHRPRVTTLGSPDVVVVDADERRRRHTSAAAGERQEVVVLDSRGAVMSNDETASDPGVLLEGTAGNGEVIVVDSNGDTEIIIEETGGG